MASEPLSYEQLVALAEQSQDQVDLAALSPAERRMVDELREVIVLMKDRESVAPPEYVRNRAFRLVRRPPAAVSPGASLIARLTAMLTFDSQSAAPLAGVRGEAGRIRQLLFSAGGFDVDLQVIPQAGRLRLLGQVLSRTAAPSGMVYLSQGPGEPVAAEIDDLGEFSFDALSPGAYALRIQLAEAEIDMPEIVLSA